MKFRVYITCQLMVLLATTGIGDEVPADLSPYVRPPEITDQELLQVSTLEELGYKIHGKNGGSKRYKCKSFEKELNDDKNDLVKDTGKDAQYNAVKYGYFSKFAYYGESEYVNAIKGSAGDEAAGYVLLSDAEIARILEGTSLTVRDGSIVSKDDIGHYEKDKENYQKQASKKTEKGETFDGHTASGSTLFDAKIFVKRDETGKVTDVVIAYRGTQFGNLRDWWDDLKQAGGATPDQYRQASELLRVVLASDVLSDASIVCTGHSLGGGLATYAMADNDLQNRVIGYTYDAAGLSGKTLDSLKEKNGGLARVVDAAKRMINIRAEKDPVSYVGYHLGNMYEIDVGNKNPLKNHDLDKLIAAMENCGQKDADPFASEPDPQNGPTPSVILPDNTIQVPPSPTPPIRHGSRGDTRARIW